MPEDKVREKLAELVVLCGGQREMAERLGVSQSSVSRFLSGSRLTPAMARAVARRVPKLRPEIEAILFGSDMQNPQVVTPSAAVA